MGVIQNSMNQMLATVMGGVLGLKHIKGQAESNEIKDNILKNQQIETKANAAEARTKAKIAKNEFINKEKEEYIKTGEEIANIKNVEIPELERKESNIQRWQKNQQQTFGKRATVRNLENVEYQKSVEALNETQGKLKAKQTQLMLKEARFNELDKKYGGKK